MAKKKNLEKMSIEEIKEYYEKRSLIYGAIFAFVLLVVALLGFFIGFQGIM